VPKTPLPRRHSHRLRTVAATSAALMLAGLAASGTAAAAAPSDTTTPIKHVIVVFQENVSFDHYFGTYPNAANKPGETPFHAAPGTPTINGLTGALRSDNPNGRNPARMAPNQALACDQDHDYKAEQLAANHGAMDGFIANTQKTTCAAPAYGAYDPGLVLNYYDGNTVTGLWNYAQHYAMNDNSYNTTFGPSTPGALNLVSGQTHGAMAHATGNGGDGHVVTTDSYGALGVDPATGVGTVINDPDPFYDKCSNPKNDTIEMTGKNIGDRLNDKAVSWGWFQGGFGDCTAKSPVGEHTVGQQSPATVTDYSPHHEPFQYYKSTANPQHTPPASVAEVGHDGPANHNYDLNYLGQSIDSGNLPAVSFVKAKSAQDGHAGYSDPLDEQRFLVNLVNKVQQSKDWASTAIVINYDDSDGWYDHQLAPVVNHSQSAQDALSSTGECGTGVPTLGGYQLRCGYGPRLPLLVISPYSKVNSVDSTLTDQTSVLRFIEDNWQTGRIGDSSFDALAGPLNGMFDFARPAATPLLLDPATGAVPAPTAGPADLQVQVSSPEFVAPGQVVSTTLTITNHGPGTATAVSTGLLLPVGSTVTDAAGGTLFGDLDVLAPIDLAPGQQRVVTITSTAPGNPGLRAAIGYAFSPTADPNWFDNVGGAVVVVR